MIESIVNIFQMICIAITVALSTYNYYRSFRREWTLLALAGGAFFLGDLYYLLFLVFYGHTPRYSSIPEYSWSAAYISLLLLVIIRSGEHFPKPRNVFQWLIPVFSVALCIFFIRVTGYYVANIISVGLMCLLAWHTVSALFAGKGSPGSEDDEREKGKLLYGLILGFCIVETVEWIISCYWMGDTIMNPYFWMDTMVSLIFLILPVALKKAVSK